MPASFITPLNRRRFLQLLSGAASIAFGPKRVWAAQEPTRLPVDWMWSGAVTPTSATVKAKVTRPPGALRLLVSSKPDFSDARTYPDKDSVVPDRDGIAAFPLDALSPGTLHYYAVEADGRRGETGRFKTSVEGPMSFSVAFGSCCSTGSRSRVFSSIERLQPQFMMHMGDLHYSNISQNIPALYRRAIDRVMTSPTQASLYRNVPITYVWDDHDFGGNDCDRTSLSRDAALSVYRQCVPHYPLSDIGDEHASVHQTFTVGRVRFIVSDCRGCRDPIRTPDTLEKSMLGKTQLDWLDRQLKAATPYPLVVWVNPLPWITREGNSEHGWQQYSSERIWIADRIKEYGLMRRLVMFSGDAHLAAIDDGSNSNYATGHPPDEKGFVIAQAAPLDRLTNMKGGPYSHGYSKRNHQFGLLKVDDDGSTISAEITCRDVDGAVINGLSIRLTWRDGSYTV